MAYCPNPECLHRRQTGKPAEYAKDVTHCTDCKTRLELENPVRPRAKIPCPAPLRRRLVFTVGVMLVSQSIPATVLGAVAVFCFWMASAKEDGYNIEKFGNEYREYMKKVPRWNFLRSKIKSNRVLHSPNAK